MRTFTNFCVATLKSRILFRPCRKTVSGFRIFQKPDPNPQSCQPIRIRSNPVEKLDPDPIKFKRRIRNAEFWVIQYLFWVYYSLASRCIESLCFVYPWLSRRKNALSPSGDNLFLVNTILQGLSPLAKRGKIDQKSSGKKTVWSW